MEQEARMILPGIQAIFGFQLIAAFNQNFKTMLTQTEQNAHLAALVCVVLATLFCLAPAAYHRQAEPGMISRRLCRIGNVFLTAALIPLMFGTCLDVYVVARLITGSRPVAALLSVLFLMAFTGTWFVFPRLSAKK